MKTINFEGRIVGVYYANSLFSGYGHRRIEVELHYRSEFKKFYTITDDMPEIDRISELENIHDKYLSLYLLANKTIDSEVQEWLNQVDNHDY